MAGVAALLELAFVRIVMAVRAGCKLDACVARLAVGAWRYGSSGMNVLVLAGEREARLRVIEGVAVDAGRFPVNRRVAPGAVVPEAALVLILVACDATGREAKPGAIQIFVR